jgi:hypothetical protein
MSWQDLSLRRIVVGNSSAEPFKLFLDLRSKISNLKSEICI